MKESMNKNSTRERQLIRRIRRDIFIKLTGAAAALILTFTLVIGVCTAPSADMFPAVRAGDLLLYVRLCQPGPSDIVLHEAGGERGIGRIQATSGTDIDETAGGLLTVSGRLLPIEERAGIFSETRVKEGGGLLLPARVPEDAYLVLGDNRSAARDSRDFGFLKKAQIKGRVFTIIRRRGL